MRKLAATNAEFVDLVRSNLDRGASSIDIASFRIGSTDGIIDFLCEVNRVAPMRLLIGLGSPTDTVIPTKSKRRAKQETDPCVAMVEEVIHQAPRVQARYLHECHLKAWIFHRSNLRESTALIGGRNLTFSKWPDFLVEVDHTYVPPVAQVFQDAWEQGDAIGADPFIQSVLSQRKANDPGYQ